MHAFALMALQLKIIYVLEIANKTNNISSDQKAANANMVIKEAMVFVSQLVLLLKFIQIKAVLVQMAILELAEHANSAQLGLYLIMIKQLAFALTRTQSSSMMHSSVLLVLPTQLQIRMPLDASATLVSFCPPTTSVLRTAETHKY